MKTQTRTIETLCGITLRAEREYMDQGTFMTYGAWTFYVEDRRVTSWDYKRINEPESQRHYREEISIVSMESDYY